MSMGTRLKAAALALKAEGLPPGVRTGELEQRLADKLAKMGCRPGEIPSRRTFLRHLAGLRALIGDGTNWHYRDHAAARISGPELADRASPEET